MTLTARLLPWLLAFAFTQLVEVPIYRRALDGRLLVAFGASAITHPVVWFFFPWLFAHWAPLEPSPAHYWTMVAAAETFAVGVEAIWLAAFGLPRALLWSLLANGSSLGLGLLSRWIFGSP
jgi:hypothetical protein